MHALEQHRKHPFALVLDLQLSAMLVCHVVHRHMHKRLPFFLQLSAMLICHVEHRHMHKKLPFTMH